MKKTVVNRLYLKQSLYMLRIAEDMKKNLISLGTLEALGFKYTSEDGVLKVIHGVLVVMKAHRSGTLYILQGSDVTSAAVVSTADKSKVDTTKLWEMRLGCMGEKGMSMLNKRDLLCGQSTGMMDFNEHCLWEAKKSLLEISNNSQNKRYFVLHSFRPWGFLVPVYRWCQVHVNFY
ncbi:hypothetical protein ACH5RR_002573 [Cinchona calisaya]|uniref:GAG-pre-integrase domain-containing protein n=1 Tax=Cinchona calisaya TaxID=153742 RepID=A0ABD3ASB0_9GENT